MEIALANQINTVSNSGAYGNHPETSMIHAMAFDDPMVDSSAPALNWNAMSPDQAELAAPVRDPPTAFDRDIAASYCPPPGFIATRLGRRSPPSSMAKVPDVPTLIVITVVALWCADLEQPESVLDAAAQG